MPSEPGMEELHAEMLLLLKEFHQICMENDIKYSLYAGTLLGAIREKGFIPWDDDMDVILMRNEYNKLQEILKRRDGEYKGFIQRVKKAPWLLPKWETRSWIWLDLFACDYISEHKITQKCKISLLMLLSATLHTKQSIADVHAADYSMIKQAGYYTAYHFGKLFSFARKVKLFDWVSQNAFCGNRTMIHCSNDIYSSMELVYPESMMSEFLLTEFEGTEVMITKRYHEVLTSVYGEDYMTPKRMTDSQKKSHSSLRERCGNLKS